MSRPKQQPRVFCYARVSTQEQEDHGHSLDEQGGRLRAYCRAHGLEAVECVYENGSAKTVAKRAGLKRVLRELKAGRADGLVVAKLDRLSRSVRDVLDLVDASGRENWDLHSIAESLNTSTAMGKFVVTLMAGLAQMERGQTGERTKAALAQLRAQGKRTSGKPPFGYRLPRRARSPRTARAARPRPARRGAGGAQDRQGAGPHQEPADRRGVQCGDRRGDRQDCGQAAGVGRIVPYFPTRLLYASWVPNQYQVHVSGLDR